MRSSFRWQEKARGLGSWRAFRQQDFTWVLPSFPVAWQSMLLGWPRFLASLGYTTLTHPGGAPYRAFSPLPIYSLVLNIKNLRVETIYNLWKEFYGNLISQLSHTDLCFLLKRSNLITLIISKSSSISFDWWRISSLNSMKFQAETWDPKWLEVYLLSDWLKWPVDRATH